MCLNVLHGTHGAPVECGEHIEYDSMWLPQAVAGDKYTAHRTGYLSWWNIHFNLHE